MQNNIEDGSFQNDLGSEILQLRLRHLKGKEGGVLVSTEGRGLGQFQAFR